MLNGLQAYCQAKAALDPQASAVFVPANLAAKAIEEAIEAEIRARLSASTVSLSIYS
jgi:succinyl-CoA synthetase alpha subunit